jgi:hypothetical protein
MVSGTTPSDHENPTSETVNLSQALSPTESQNHQANRRFLLGATRV